MSSLLSNKSSPSVCNLVKFMRKLVIFSKFCTLSEYGLSILKFDKRTLYMTSPFEEGSTEEYLVSQTTSVKFCGIRLGMWGNDSSQLWAKYR